ncbi:MAG TPA: DinB family protein [Leptospiraceae bacterium]|nr:DinB family protein [Leptospiraceae bacterium]HMZ61596.1 DinB family protein [Leptospiraceae bacterium]HNF13954.1 DinB family protein [Leptospiraceae bacterium]HNF27755.1 DinB family protein [Leptospiraceae bacterium]HNH11328.1 DinB family protein [Leptospiraceae bacterium]
MIELQNPDPHSRAEILSAIDDAVDQASSFYTSLGPEIFFHDGLGGWSPAQNISHIADITSLAVLLFRMPKFFLLPFGRRKTQKNFSTLLSEYIGAEKPIFIGPLAPSSIPLPENAQETVQKLTARFRNMFQDLKKVLQEIPEEEFDRYSMPHPSLGMLSFREMVYVVIIHIIHHTYKVEKKTGRLIKKAAPI